MFAPASASARDSRFDAATATGLWLLAKRVVDREMAPLLPVLIAMATSHWDLGVRPSVVLRSVALKALLAPSGGADADPSREDAARVRWFLEMVDGDGVLDASALDEGERRLFSNSHARQFVRDVVSSLRERATPLQLTCCENAGFIGAWTDGTGTATT